MTGAPAVLLIDGATFLVSALLVGFLVPAQPGGAARGSYLAELRTGFAYLRTDRLMAAILLMVLFTNALDSATGAVLLPVYAKEILHSSVALGLITGVYAAAAMVGTVIYGWLGPRLPRWSTYTTAFLLVGAPKFGLLAMEPGLPVILGWLAFIGIGVGALNPILAVVEYERLPAGMRAKVLGLTQGGAFAAMPLGALLGGFAVDSLGITAALLATGGLYLLGTLCPLVFPAWREMDAPGRDNADH